MTRRLLPRLCFLASFLACWGGTVSWGELNEAHVLVIYNDADGNGTSDGALITPDSGENLAAYIRGETMALEVPPSQVLIDDQDPEIFQSLPSLRMNARSTCRTCRP